MSESGLYDWVVTSDIPTVVNRIRAIREGQPGVLDPQPAKAIQLLQTFALRRPIDDLLRLTKTEETEGFAPLDATAVLALAALTRPVKEAARLAIEHWMMESRDATRPPLTDSIVHDVTAQRTVQEVAVFIRVCRREGPPDLVSKALRAFVMMASGRTSLDKALLYIALRDELCTEDAAELLWLTLTGASEERSAPAAAGFGSRVGVVGALRHLSPSEGIVEDWIDQVMEVAKREPGTVKLVADLLVGEPEDSRGLAEHVGRSWKPRRLIDLCEMLAKRSPACSELVRRYAAARPDKDSLAEIIELWHRSEVLAGTLKHLLADIVAGGDGSSSGPRPIDFLENLPQTLENDRAPRKCCKELRVSVAAQVRNRTGKQVAFLLGQVGRAELRRAAQSVNEQITMRLLEHEIDSEAFVDYHNGLQDLPEASSLTFWALHELSDPTASDHALEGTAAVIGDVAARLYEEGLADIGFDLLERCLENEQWLDAEDAVGIVGRGHRGAMPKDERWDSLLSATVGRWAESRRRDEVVAALRRESYDKDAEAVIRSVQ